ncbi:MAG: rod shape-determining protein [Rubricoccaceae bacterium]|nr:rod shape-determining protein [Rubricoccaceae bacterium]
MPAKKTSKTASKATSKKAKPAASAGPLHVGIDLGTSRSAVVASNGQRAWVESYVGWPKDFVARKMIGRPVLYGEEALRHRLSLDLVRPLENGVVRDGTARDQEAVRELVRYLIDAVRPANGQPVQAAVGVPAEALRTNKLALREAVGEHADALMVVSEPFAVAYGLDALDGAMVIDIGAGTADFCVMHGTMPGEDDQRTLALAGDHIDEQLKRLIEEQYPQARFSENALRQLKERSAFVGKPEGTLTTRGADVAQLGDYDVTEAMQHACESIVPALVETALDLLSRYEPDFQEVVRKNVYLAGGGSQIRGLAEMVEAQLSASGPTRVRVVDDPLYSGAEGALALAEEMPEEYWEEM